MKSLFGGLLIAAGVAVLAVGVLAGVEVLLSSPSRRPRRSKQVLESEEPPPVPETRPVEAAAAIPKKGAERNFSIKRTKSEVGYVYWILEGYGKYKCFILCDSWDEAVAQAQAKMAEIDGVEAKSQSIPVSA
jgi:hypothetical protein